MYARIEPDEVASILMENSGLTFPDLAEMLNADCHDQHPAYMDLIMILRDFADAELISLDGYTGEQHKLAEAIDRECCNPSRVGMRPRIRLSRHFGHVQHALGFSLPGKPSLPQIPWTNFTFHARPLFEWPKPLETNADVFVIMPFAVSAKPLYTDHIAPTVKRAGLTVARADDLFTSNSVMQDVWSGIYHCRAVIADCTDRNPNVFYELGIAHTIGKPTILLTRDKGDIPADIRHWKYILYDFTPRGMKEFETMLSETLDSVVISPFRRADAASHGESWLLVIDADKKSYVFLGPYENERFAEGFGDLLEIKDSGLNVFHETIPKDSEHFFEMRNYLRRDHTEELNLYERLKREFQKAKSERQI